MEQEQWFELQDVHKGKQPEEFPISKAESGVASERSLHGQ
jgi:hypothetical protein